MVNCVKRRQIGLSEISAKVDQVRNDLPTEAEVPRLNIESADSLLASAYLCLPVCGPGSPATPPTTSIVAGYLPLLLVSGAGAAARNSIGLVLVGGMTIGTLFTLFVIPSVYMLIAKDHKKVNVPASAITSAAWYIASGELEV